MVHIAKDITWLIGRTPLVEIGRFGAGSGGRLLAKLESHNPSGSNKDRAVLAILDDAERCGALRPGGTILECSSGDTSIALAVVAAARGHRVVVVLPGTVCEERCRLLRSLGAELVITEGALGMRGALQRLEQVSREMPEAFVMQPFTNRANARAHEQTAREIWQDTDGQVAAVVCPVGTGGTAAGCARFFATTPRQVPVWGVEPATCAVLSGKPAGKHDLPGLGVGFVPEILSIDALAGAIAVTHAQACAAAREVARLEGLLAGPAGGAVLHAAREVAARPELVNELVVAIVPDHAERYPGHGALSERGCS